MATELLGRQWERRSLRPVEARADNPWFDLQSLDFIATGRPATSSVRSWCHFFHRALREQTADRRQNASLKAGVAALPALEVRGG
jgi:hypothetical protein